MSVHLKPCIRCRKLPKEKRTDKRGRKLCTDCRWIAIAPPRLGRKSLGVYTTKEEAEKQFQATLVDYRRGVDPLPRNLTVENVMERYFRAATAELSLTTLHRYRELWNIHGIALANHIISDLRRTHITTLYADLRRNYRGKHKPLSARTVGHLHRVLHRAFKWSVQNDLIGANIFATVSPPKAKKSDARALTFDEAEAFFAKAKGTRYEMFFIIAVLTAARRGELCGLKWDSVDLDSAMMMIRRSLAATRAKKKARSEGAPAVIIKSPKSGSSREVPLDIDAIAAFRRISASQAANKLRYGSIYGDEGFVFTDSIGGPIKLDAPTKAFRKIADQAGLANDVKLHSLRHSFSSWSLAAGAEIVAVQRVLGHSVPSTTLNLYGHVVEGGRKRAVDGVSQTLRRIRAR